MSADARGSELRLIRLRESLLDAQFELNQRTGAALILVASGIPAAGRTETVARLVEWLDPKYVERHAVPEPAAGPGPAPYWRWWPAVPAKGLMSIVYGGWYEDLLTRPHAGRMPAQALRAAAREIREFERVLVRERVLVLKLHFTISRGLQRRRLAKLAADPATAWRVSKRDRDFARHFRRHAAAVRTVLHATGHADAPWQVIDGAHTTKRERSAGRALLAAFRLALRVAHRAQVQRHTVMPRPARVPVLPSAPPHAVVDPQAEVESLQGRLARLTHHRRFARHGLVVAFEGMDGAGKSSVVRRVTGALDPRQYRLVPVGRPSPEELAHPYLWRVWRALPGRGEIVLFDRSWYGRVLVERVDGLCAVADWQRAFREIREFEAACVAHGMILVKFWLSVSRAEQLARFRARESTPLKRFKIEPADWRARRKWPQYQVAARAAVARTSRPGAPWILIEADDKDYARVKVLKSVCAALERALEG